MTNEILVIVVLVFSVAAQFIAFILNDGRIKKIENIMVDLNTRPEPTPLKMSFDEMTKIVDSTFKEVQEKYALYYLLKELSVIPKMDQEIRSMAKEVLNAFSPEFRKTLYTIYSEEYVIQMVTRKCQQFMIDYTDKHKPRSK